MCPTEPELPRGISYNEWLRSANRSSQDTLEKTTAKLLVALQALQFQCQLEITMAPSQVYRVQVKMDSLLTEIHLLDIIREMD